MNKHCCYLQYFLSEYDPQICRSYCLREAKDKHLHVYKIHMRHEGRLNIESLYILFFPRRTITVAKQWCLQNKVDRSMCVLSPSTLWQLFQSVEGFFFQHCRLISIQLLTLRHMLTGGEKGYLGVLCLCPPFFPISSAFLFLWFFMCFQQ